MKHRTHELTLTASSALLLIDDEYLFLHFSAPLFYIKSVRAQGVNRKGFIFVLPLCCFAVLSLTSKQQHCNTAIPQHIE